MSQEELDTNKATEETSEVGLSSSGDTWLERNSHLFPNLFTKKVVENRNEGICPLFDPGKKLYEPVARKLDRKPDGRGRTTHVTVHFDPKDLSYTIRTVQGDVTIKKSKSDLQTAISQVSSPAKAGDNASKVAPSQWVRIDGLCLSRTELKSAILKLEERASKK